MNDRAPARRPLVLLAVMASAGLACSNGSSTSPRSPAELGIDLANADRCDPIVPNRCLLPLPNDFYTSEDPTSPTGKRIHFVAESLPANAQAKHIDPAEWNRNDGFSPGSAVLVSFPGVDLAASRAPRIDDTQASLAVDAPIVAIDAESGERRPLWAELDAFAPNDAERTLILRAAVDWRESHRYVVAFRGLSDAAGAALEPSPAFRAYRDGERTTDGAFEARRGHFEQMFDALEAAGVARDDLQLAFDFTIASREGLSSRILRVRDDAFARLGDAAPEFTIDNVEERLEDRVARRVTGT